MNKLLFKQSFFALIILAFMSSCSGSPTAQLPTETPTPLLSPTTQSTTNPALIQPDYWPTQGWKTSTPEQQGMDSAQIAKLFDAIQKTSDHVHSVVIIRNGYIVAEAYFAPFQPDARHTLNFATRIVVSSLIGIAIQQGYIKGVDQKMLDFFPDLKIDNLDARKQTITIRDLLTLTSGLSTNDSGMVSSDNWVQYALDKPMANDPGKAWDPSVLYHLLSAILQKATGMTALIYANKVLFEPLGIMGAGWIKDPQGINFGESYLCITPRDMAKIGYLYLNNGLWDGKQIIPKEYVLSSTKKMFDTDSSAGIGYGWYVDPDGNYYAPGSYGQLISVKPAQGIITIFTGGPSQGFWQDEEDLVDTLIVPAVKSADALPEKQTGMALLKATIDSLEKPAPQPIPPLPKIAQTVSGKKYLLSDGEAFTFTFTGDQAKLDWAFKGKSVQFPVGMDNIYRTTSRDQSDKTSLFGAKEQPLGDVFLALRGQWLADDTFQLTMQNLDSFRLHLVTFKFAGDQVNISHSGIGPSDSADLHGQVQAP